RRASRLCSLTQTLASCGERLDPTPDLPGPCRVQTGGAVRRKFLHLAADAVGVVRWLITAQLVVGDSKNTITLARSSADVSPPYGFMLLPGTTSSGFAMKRSSFSLSHTKSAPFMALE